MTKYLLRTDYSDKAFLKKAVLCISFLSQAIPNQIISIKNCASEHIFCSEYLAQLIGVDAKEVIGKKVLLPLYDYEIAIEAIIAAEDQAIMTSRLPIIVLKINRFTKGLTPYTSIKSPLINPSTNNVVGILFQGFEIGLTSLNQYLAKDFSPVGINKLEIAKPPHLSKREKEVIFFFLANLSSQEIAEMLYKIEGKRITKSTIDSLFNDQLYVKFNVRSRPALYKALKKMGYENRIPRELLATSSIVLDPLNPY